MNSSNLILIVCAEIALLLLCVCVFLVIQNRSLRKLVSQLKSKAQDLLQDLKLTRGQEEIAQTAPPEELLVYIDYVDQQIQLTIEHHQELKSNQDIVLDIEPGTPLPHRTAALRHAMLFAEKDAFSNAENGGKPDWQALRAKYDQIFSFYEDFSEQENIPTEELEAVRVELDNARNRVKNLEKFKQLYFDLEDKWNDSKKEAQTHYEDLSNIASRIDVNGEFGDALESYRASYDDVAQLIERGVEGASILQTAGQGALSSTEVQHLRAVAADQHKIIEGLQRQLKNASTEEERNQIIGGLQEELNKQVRFVQESETCIQLLEDELNIASKDIEQLRSKLNRLPQIKSEIINIRKQHDSIEMKYHATLTENRKLLKQLNDAGKNNTREDANESIKLRKALNNMETKYNQLEEKFLDLKLQQ